MSNFKKFLGFTAITAAAAAGGIFLYKKLQENKLIDDQDEDDDFEDFEDDFDDDFDDFESDNRSYTAIVTDPEVATEDNATETEATEDDVTEDTTEA